MILGILQARALEEAHSQEAEMPSGSCVWCGRRVDRPATLCSHCMSVRAKPEGRALAAAAKRRAEKRENDGGPQALKDLFKF